MKHNEKMGNDFCCKLFLFALDCIFPLSTNSIVVQPNVHRMCEIHMLKIKFFHCIGLLKTTERHIK